MHKPVALIVLDGFGLADPGPGNAVHLARTPNFDRYWADCPHTRLEASGKAVGLPAGQMGNSEVGHMNLGAGRVVMQSLSYIDHLIESGEFFRNQVLREAFRVKPGRTLHLMGLVSRGGVHSELEHVFALLELARREKAGPVRIHVFTDGRDTAPDSGAGYVEELEAKIRGLGQDIRIASVCGRYFAMDRDRRWPRVKSAYDAIVCGLAEFQAGSGVEAVRQAYARGETDEFIKATVVVNPQGRPWGPIESGDSVFFFNFRADRARQMTRALLGDASWAEFERCRILEGLHYTSLMEYDEELGRPFAFELPSIDDTLSEVLSRARKKQYHTAETEKYPHVTYFFNALKEEPPAGEDRVLIPSPQVATYDLQPEMSAPELTEATLKRIREHDDDFILLNYANPDMVGHTGVLQAAIQACEAADQGLGRLVDAIRAKGGSVVILADHGNAEVMFDENGGPHTAHTTNPVPFVIVGEHPGLPLREGGKLGDVAPTILELMGLEIPAAMTGQSLLSTAVAR